MHTKVFFASLGTILVVGCVVKAQTVVSKPASPANLFYPHNRAPLGDRGDGMSASIANVSIAPEAMPLARKMINSGKLSHLGRIALAASDYATAERYFRQALTAYPRSNEAQIGLAQTLEREGRVDQASVSYQKAFNGTDALSSHSTFPTDMAALARHGLLSEESGQHQEAVKSYNMVRQWLGDKSPLALTDKFDPKGLPSPRLQAMLNLAQGVALVESKNQDGQDRSEEALEAFQEAAQQQPNDARVQYYLGYGYQKAGQFAAAQAAFGKAARLDTEGTVKAAVQERLPQVQAHRR